MNYFPDAELWEKDENFTTKESAINHAENLNDKNWKAIIVYYPYNKSYRVFKGLR